MFKQLKGFLIGVITTCVIGSCIAYASGTWKTISVLENDIVVMVDGKKLDKENFLYEGTTYLSLRAVAEAVGKDVNYDPETRTAYIGSVPQSTTSNILSNTYTNTYYGLTLYEDSRGIKYVSFGDVTSDCTNSDNGIFFLLPVQETNTWNFIQVGASAASDKTISSGSLYFFDNMKGAYILADDYINTMENILH